MRVKVLKSFVYSTKNGGVSAVPGKTIDLPEDKARTMKKYGFCLSIQDNTDTPKEKSDTATIKNNKMVKGDLKNKMANDSTKNKDADEC